MRKTILIAGVLTLAGLQSGPAHAAGEGILQNVKAMASYKASCASAEEARKMAAEFKYEWNTTAPLIAKAEEAASAGDFAKAVKLCDKARFQGEAAVAQAKQQADAWRAAVVK